MALPSRETQAAEPATSDYLSWEAPGAPAVRIHLDVVDAISTDAIDGFNALRRRGVEVGGILLGRTAAESVFIEGCERVACEYRFGPSYILSDRDQKNFEETRARLASDPTLSIVGYYRSHTRRNLQLERSDLEVIERWFNGPEFVFLIVKPLDITHLIAEIFFWEDGTLPMQSAQREFPFAGRGAGAFAGAKPIDFTPLRENVAEPRPLPIPPVRPEREVLRPSVRPNPRLRQPPKRGIFARYWEAVAAVFLVLCAAGLFVWQHWGGDDSDAAVQPAASVAAPSSLGLDVRPDPGVWHVVWKRDLPAIRNATRGVLAINDGKSRTEVPLGPDQLRGGGVPYRHLSDDVAFRLEVFGPDNQSSSESFRVLLAAQTKAANTVAEAAVEKPGLSHGFVPAEVLERVRPKITQGIKSRITRNAVVMVKVNIDATGAVTSAIPITHGDALIAYLSTRASEAAKHWRFKPARNNGVPGPSSQVIRFVFEK
ncbi:MAG: energy transducer TonB [Acidobacteriota bacterium]|nr:energy transducer TonB [Acidobacteriota bacterium]